MEVSEAQREMREVYLNAGPGQAVAAGVWLASAACATWGSFQSAVLTLVVSGVFIFPLTKLILLLMGGRTSVRKTNPLRPRAPQVAFVAPFLMPLAYPITLYR